MKIFHCSDAGFDCKAVVNAVTNEEVLKQVGVHAKEVHGVTVTPELAQQLKMLIKDEEQEAHNN